MFKLFMVFWSFVCYISVAESQRLQAKMHFFLDTVLDIKHSIRYLRDDVSLLQQQNTTTTCNPAVCEASQSKSVETVIEELESRITTVLKGFREEKWGLSKMIERHDRLSEDLDKVKSEVTKVTKGQQEITDLEHRILTKMWKIMYGNEIKQYGTSLYIFHSEKMTWNQSQQACQEEMFHLAEINDWNEHLFVVQLAKSKYAWLGATDVGNTGTWQWLTSGIAVQDYLWWKGEPNNIGNNEHCLQYTETGYNDNVCEKELESVCELEL